MSLWSISVLKQRNSAEGVDLRRRSTLLPQKDGHKKINLLELLNIKIVAKNEEISCLFIFSNCLVF